MYSIILRIIVGHYVNSPPNKRFYCIDGFHSDFDLVPRKPISSSFLSLIPWKSKRTLLKPCVFYRKVIENNGPLHFHEYNLFFRGAQVLCRQQFAFHLCDGVPAKSGAWTLPSAHAWTRWAMDLTKSGLLSLVRLDRVYPKTWDWPNCYAFFFIFGWDSVASLSCPRVRAPGACYLTGLVTRSAIQADRSRRKSKGL